MELTHKLWTLSVKCVLLLMLLVFFPTSKVTKEAEILQEVFSLIFIIRKTFTGQQQNGLYD